MIGDPASSLFSISINEVEWNWEKRRSVVNDEMSWVDWSCCLRGYGRCSANGSAKEERTSTNQLINSWTTKLKKVNGINQSTPWAALFINEEKAESGCVDGMGRQAACGSAVSERQPIQSIFLPLREKIDGCGLLFPLFAAPLKKEMLLVMAGGPLAPHHSTPTILQLFSFQLGCSFFVDS